MKNIDFLPAAYHEQTVHRKANVWRSLVGVVSGLLLLISFVSQQWLYHRAQAELAELQAPYEQAQALTQRLSAAQAELKAANVEAQLFTYLRHPWPRSRLLSLAIEPLPDCITLRQMRIVLENVTAVEPTGPRPAAKNPNDPDAPKLSPAQRDLNRLREENDKRQTVLELSGITTDTAALQRYLVTLGDERLFAKAELTSLEANQSEKVGTWRFTARLAVRPGYGQTGGPTELKEQPHG